VHRQAGNGFFSDSPLTCGKGATTTLTIDSLQHLDFPGIDKEIRVAQTLTFARELPMKPLSFFASSPVPKPFARRFRPFSAAALAACSSVTVDRPIKESKKTIFTNMAL
jgi:hypothetical protein